MLLKKLLPSEIEARRCLKSKSNNGPVDEVIYRKQNAKIQKLLRRDKEKYSNVQCQRIENYSVKNTTKELYQGVRNITRKFKPIMDTIKLKMVWFYVMEKKSKIDGTNTAATNTKKRRSSNDVN